MGKENVNFLGLVVDNADNFLTITTNLFALNITNK